ncbi:hypothetical protein M446_6173 [Methylobacterium sp. 4-46]|uniref:hypothetical protein n=1 Tax=unclassified Methylobacterium TaxID=2615210 RepID=UPI000165CDE6|nr:MULTISPECIES: hypothetical protein [Methylobacterium]ACA20442.1 hypothetical protein M446_6173 [Methylobacterium sp. 4-46]WFT79612.1 hypothetical protein QA634_31155 [Methylobacterium nodulans]
MTVAVSIVSLLLVLFLISRGVPGRQLLVILAVTAAVVLLIVGVERSGLWPAELHTR